MSEEYYLKKIFAENYNKYRIFTYQDINPKGESLHKILSLFQNDIEFEPVEGIEYYCYFLYMNKNSRDNIENTYKYISTGLKLGNYESIYFWCHRLIEIIPNYKKYQELHDKHPELLNEKNLLLMRSALLSGETMPSVEECDKSYAHKKSMAQLEKEFANYYSKLILIMWNENAKFNFGSFYYIDNEIYYNLQNAKNVIGLIKNEKNPEKIIKLEEYNKFVDGLKEYNKLFYYHCVESLKYGEESMTKILGVCHDSIIYYTKNGKPHEIKHLLESHLKSDFVINDDFCHCLLLINNNLLNNILLYQKKSYLDNFLNSLYYQSNTLLSKQYINRDIIFTIKSFIL